MIAVSLTDITKSYGATEILRGVTLTVSKGERIGIVGPNGAGKSTLLRILAGLTEPTGGSFFTGPNLRVGYLRQEKTVLDPDDNTIQQGEWEGTTRKAETPAMGRTILEMAMAARERMTKVGLDIFESEAKGVLIGLGFSEEDMTKPMIALSGGERARFEIALLIMGKPDILLLDEPTNHLDLDGLAWLENRIRNFHGSVLLISHDRYFLDRTVNVLCELEDGKLQSYKGGFAAYREQKEARRAAEEQAFENEMAEYKRQEDMIRRFKERGTEKLAKRAASREKKLLREGRPEAPEHSGREEAAKMRFAPAKRSGGDVLLAEGLSKSFDELEEPLFKNVDMDIKREERICIIGANGSGKTTLLKILEGRIPADSGRISLGIKVRIGYYDQHQEELTSANTLLDEMRGFLPRYTDTELRSLLGRFLFRGDKVFQEISTLSGGEKARLALLKLMVSGANTLLLDEPTNHLDIPSMEAIESALMGFEGTLIIVSHDRWLLERIPRRIMELTPFGLQNYIGNFHDYLNKKGALRESPSGPKAAKPVSAGAESYLRKKEAESARRKYLSSLKRTEDKISSLESEILELKQRQESESAASDYALLTELQADIEERQAELEKNMEEWEALAAHPVDGI